MSDKLAATFHGVCPYDHRESMWGRCALCGMTWEQQTEERRRKDWAEAPHPDDPRSELGNDGLTDEERAAGVAPMFEMYEVIDSAEPIPEQALRAHIADLLTDVDHFDGCHTMVEGDGTCTCLVGRLERAINAEQTAIDVIARSVTEQMLGDAGQEIGDLWGDYPEIGESDWQAVVSLVMWRARSGKPDEATHREAYEHLKGRAEGGAA